MPFIYPEVYVNTCYKSEDCFVVNSISRTIYGLNIMLNFFSWGDTDELVLGLYVVRVLWRLLLYEGKIKINTYFFKWIGCDVLDYKDESPIHVLRLTFIEILVACGHHSLRLIEVKSYLLISSPLLLIPLLSSSPFIRYWRLTVTSISVP